MIAKQNISAQLSPSKPAAQNRDQQEVQLHVGT